MAVAATDCMICELEEALQSRAREVRRELNRMNPAKDPAYDALFKVLVAADQDLAMLKGRARKPNRKTESR